MLYLKGVSDKNSLIRLLEFLYCDKFVKNITPFQIRGISELCKTLGLIVLSSLFRKKAEFAHI